MADNFYARYPDKPDVTSLNSLTGALTLAAGSNITITPSGGNTLTIASTGGGSGANTALSNLDVTTAINADLTFANRGGGAQVIVKTANITGDNTDDLTLTTGDSSDAASGSLNIISGTGAAATGNVNIQTGIPSDPAGSPGNINIQPGLSTSVGFPGGNVTITAGIGDSGGGLDLQAGTATGDNSTGGTVGIRSGGISGMDSTSGNINVIAPAGSGTGEQGIFVVQTQFMRMPSADADPVPVVNSLNGGEMYYNTITGKFRGYNAVAIAWEDLNQEKIWMQLINVYLRVLL